MPQGLYEQQGNNVTKQLYSLFNYLPVEIISSPTGQLSVFKGTYKLHLNMVVITLLNDWRDPQSSIPLIVVSILNKEHSLGVIFFLLTFLMLCCIFFLQFPVFLSCLPCCHMYVVHVWTGWWLISLVLVTSDNKGLLLKGYYCSFA